MMHRESFPWFVEKVTTSGACVVLPWSKGARKEFKSFERLRSVTP